MLEMKQEHKANAVRQSWGHGQGQGFSNTDLNFIGLEYRFHFSNKGSRWGLYALKVMKLPYKLQNCETYSGHSPGIWLGSFPSTHCSGGERATSQKLNPSLPSLSQEIRIFTHSVLRVNSASSQGKTWK